MDRNIEGLCPLPRTASPAERSRLSRARTARTLRRTRIDSSTFGAVAGAAALAAVVRALSAATAADLEQRNGTEFGPAAPRPGAGRPGACLRPVRRSAGGS